MILQILIPQYKETDDVIRPLLDSIKIQKNVNFNDIGVIIVNDGTDVKLSNKLLKSYPFKIEYIANEHKGVSATRNCCLDHATADYVMFCDADDMFSNIIGIQLILETIRDYPFEILTSTFVEELLIGDGQYRYNLRENDNIFVHGKIFNRKFLIDNNIRWGDELLVHEDSYFNCLALSVAKNKRYIQTPFYMWCWNSNSVSRSDKYYVVKTYNHLIKSAYKLSDDLLKRDKLVDSMTMFSINIFQTFYIMTGKFSEIPELKPVIDNLKPLAKEFYDKFSELFEKIDEKDLFEIREKTQRACMEQGWYKETITFKDWLKSLQN